MNATTPLGNVASPGSKITLLGNVTGNAANPSCEDWPLTADCLPSDYDSHTVGNLKFGPDGMLYVTVGDGASYASVDVRALRAQNLDRLSGKILRVNPANGQGIATNPFWTGTATDTRSKVWAYGVRNAFRFNFKPGTNIIYIGDVGWDAWEEQKSSPPGDNLGWPCYEGNFAQAGYAAYATCQNLLPSQVTFGIHSIPLPGAAAVGGAFTGSEQLQLAVPEHILLRGLSAQHISVLKVDGADNVVPGSINVFTSAADGPVQIEIGPEGDVYYLAILTGEVRRIRFVGDNCPPS